MAPETEIVLMDLLRPPCSWTFPGQLNSVFHWDMATLKDAMGEQG